MFGAVGLRALVPCLRFATIFNIHLACHTCVVNAVSFEVKALIRLIVDGDRVETPAAGTLNLSSSTEISNESSCITFVLKAFALA